MGERTHTPWTSFATVLQWAGSRTWQRETWETHYKQVSSRLKTRAGELENATVLAMQQSNAGPQLTSPISWLLMSWSSSQLYGCSCVCNVDSLWLFPLEWHCVLLTVFPPQWVPPGPPEAWLGSPGRTPKGVRGPEFGTLVSRTVLRGGSPSSRLDTTIHGLVAESPRFDWPCRLGPHVPEVVSHPRGENSGSLTGFNLETWQL